MFRYSNISYQTLKLSADHGSFGAICRKKRKHRERGKLSAL